MPGFLFTWKYERWLNKCLSLPLKLAQLLVSIEKIEMFSRHSEMLFWILEEAGLEKIHWGLIYKSTIIW